jgi:hypothetical protein
MTAINLKIYIKAMIARNSPQKMKIEEQNLTESTTEEPHPSTSNSKDIKRVHEDLKLLEEKINSRSKESANDSSKKREWNRFSIDGLKLDINM